MIDWLSANWEKLLWLTLLSVGVFVLSLAAVAFLLVKLPEDYFCADKPVSRWGERRPVLRWLFLIGKNLLGLVIIGLGVVQLVGPGQGILSILIGVMLLNFPGKQRLQRWIVSRPRVLSAVNKFRRRFGKPALMLARPGCSAEGHDSGGR